MAIISRVSWEALLVGFCTRLVIANPAAPVTEGPQAQVSFTAHPSFSTLKPCAQGCLQYNGVYHCSLQGYWDLGKEIKCGCSPQNYCFCDAREEAAVTSYINKCVATQCTLPGEVSAVLDVYNGYCATANTALAATSSMSYTFTGVTSVTSKTPVVAGESETTNQAAKTRAPTEDESHVNIASQSDTSKPILGLGAIIGISVGGVVLIAALLCAGGCLIWRRKRNKKKVAAAAAASNPGTQGFAIGTNSTTPETSYVLPVGGAAQLDAKPGVKLHAKPFGSVGGSTTVSPLQTPQPTPQPAQATMHTDNSYTQTGVAGRTFDTHGAHEVQANPGLRPEAHEMYGSHKLYQGRHEDPGSTRHYGNAHEMYVGQSPTTAHEVHGNDGYYTSSHERYGNNQYPPTAQEMRGVRQEDGTFSPITSDMAHGRRYGNDQVAEIYTQSPRLQGATL